jgi:DNA-binding transcriptional LysR family regulator
MNMDTSPQNFRSPSVRHIAYFLAAAEESSITRAARRLHVSQPAVSAAIAALEQHFATKLFVRKKGSGIELTSFGTALMKQARALRESLHTFATFGLPQAEVRGEVTLSCFSVLAPYILPRILLHLRHALPGVAFHYTETDLEGVRLDLRRGSVDLGISYDLGFEDDFEVETIYELQPAVICGSAHPFARREAIRLRELHKQKLILLDQPLSVQYVLTLLKSHKADPTIVARVRGFELQRSLVASNFGIAVSHTLPKTRTAYDGRPVHTIAIADKLAPQRVILASARHDRERALLATTRREILGIFASGAL